MDEKPEQEIIDEETAAFRRELNQLIKDTIPYRHGKFRFKVYKGAGDVYNFIIADVNWSHQFGEEFKAIAYKHGWTLRYNSGKGIYKMYPLERNGENRNDNGDIVETLLEGDRYEEQGKS